jgi:tRNA(Ser,Leu) C12 N-acetylase TAN1
LDEEANLLVTFDYGVNMWARNEVLDVLREVGEENLAHLYSEVKGLFQLRVDGDPKEVTRKLDALCRIDPSRFWYTYHWIPVERWCPSTIEDMSEIVKELAERIRSEERWRMSIHKRFYPAHHTRELIENLAQHVDRPNVDLEHPEKIIRIEIIGGRAGLSLRARCKFK